MTNFRALIVPGLLITMAASASAQAPQVRMDQFSLEGQIQAVTQGGMQIQSDSNQTWRVAIPQNAKVTLTGNAKPDFLQVGMFVRLDGEFDKRGVAKEKVSKLTVFTLNPKEICGSWPQGTEGAGQATGFGGGDEAAGPGFPPADTPKRPKAGKEPKAAKAVQYPAALTVAGRITAFRNNSMTLNTGDANFKVDLAQDAAVSIKASDYSMAKQGDTVSVKGKAMPGAQFGQANEVKIVRAEVDESATVGKGKAAKPKPVKKDPPPKKEPAAKKEPAVKKDPPAKGGNLEEGMINGFE